MAASVIYVKGANGPLVASHVENDDEDTVVVEGENGATFSGSTCAKSEGAMDEIIESGRARFSNPNTGDIDLSGRLDEEVEFW
jgi:hypothetical protein